VKDNRKTERGSVVPTQLRPSQSIECSHTNKLGRKQQVNSPTNRHNYNKMFVVLSHQVGMVCYAKIDN
jgi:hypothetical protein